MSSSFPRTETPPWTDRPRVSITPNRSTDVGPSPLHRVQHLAEALLSARGEASGAIVARELHDDLWSLGAEDRRAFYRFLAANFRPAADPLRIAAEAYLADGSAEAAARLAKTADPPRQELLRRMNMSPGGTETLVAMRKELLGHLGHEPALKLLDGDLRHLFASWFNRGFLELRCIDWQSPAAVLEKLIAYEAVHEIQGWDDLRRRLAPDRRCFGFFHPALPGEPLIFVEVALVQGLAAAVQPLLARDDGDAQTARARTARADTAIFYSISNCQEGLRGVSFGNLLIKQVVEELRAGLPQLKHFSTLSPVPGFRRWLEKQIGTGLASTGLLGPMETPSWWRDTARAEAVRRPLLRLCATYLAGAGGPKESADSVARFHLSNGARLERVNWLGNVAPRGMQESYGIMVNYLYDPETIEANHEAFAKDGTVVRSPEVDALMVAAASPVGTAAS